MFFSFFQITVDYSPLTQQASHLLPNIPPFAPNHNLQPLYVAFI